ncbi:RNA-dependent RNA polymerase [Botrytis cinerea ourmia-like virus 17]|uniref:RNA-dependent RNA polymerase n=1 Tax=Botrytis cinerea ourmia-like virus 17 TaxID=2735951 RepID=A0ABX6NZ61_9VIRU|nr:RNA-dependent RNA polymerase [Botrytis cinerea ourmia-like virus 17]QJT73683.1 RNA-dependent RNA polymerase [Botrytis cinerea ourmia-like virus 17]
MKVSDDSIGKTGKAFVKQGSTCTRCPAAGSLTTALKRAVHIISLEYKIPNDTCLPTEMNCSTLRAWWNEWTVSTLGGVNTNKSRGRRLAMMVKSGARLFDLPCRKCDKVLSGAAKTDWIRSVGKPTPPNLVPSDLDLDNLIIKVRKEIRGWGRRLASARDSSEEPCLGDYVPGVQGCAELPTILGGTLGVSESEYSGQRNSVRLGCAKTKGKFRVVTMQSAEVKRVLTPVHNALYGHISSKGWCVRGDVLKGDFDEIVNDRKDGESYISGDYTAATNKIYSEAVQVIVNEIAHTPELTSTEREVFVESFRDMWWFSLADSGAMKRGSPMGSLCNFPILCLLNKACFEIACDNLLGRRRKELKRVKINGDDIMFAGTPSLYGEWRRVTGIYGLEVNESKTEISKRWLDLNSQSYDAKKGKMVAKATLGFLRPERKEPGAMLRAVIVGMKGFRTGHIMQVITMLRHEVALRGVTEDLTEIGPYWRKTLVKKKWFRQALAVGKCPEIRRGQDRSMAVEPGPPPKERFYAVVTRLAAMAQCDNTKEWTGKKVKPLSVQLDRRAWKCFDKEKNCLADRRYIWKGVRWRFLWPKELLTLVKNEFPSVLDPRPRKWTTDHPFLTREPVGRVERKRMYSSVSPPSCLLPIEVLTTWEMEQAERAKRMSMSV